MAYDDIRISELPSLPELHANDLILVQDVTNNLAHRIDWGRLKNSLGTLSKGITFPLGTEQQPEIAIGDHTSGIMAEDYGTFVIVTHGEKRLKVNQAGTIELINGNVLIGNYDRQCSYALVVNNITTFNCYASFTSGADIDGNLNVTGNITGGKKFNVPGDVILGTDCENSLVINGEIFGKCNMDLKGNMAIHKNLTVDESATILGNVSIGTSCINTFDVYSNAWFRCDLRVDGDLSFGGDLVLDGDVNIGGGCSNKINLNGETTVYCDLRVKGETYLEQNLYVNHNTAIDGNLFAKEDTILGIGCQYTTTINSSLTAECTSFFRGAVTIGDPSIGCPGTNLLVNGTVEAQCNVVVREDLIVDHNTTLGTNCNDALLVKATPVFECDAEFRKGVNITDDLFVGGDFTTTSHLVSIGDDRGCVNPNIINLNGEVHIECNLFVSGTVLYDGDLEITGPNITIGAGCGSSNINLQGYTIAHCDMLIKGDIAPYALTVAGNTEIQTNLEVRGTFDVAGDSAHDSKLYVHLDTFLNLPVPAHNYWEQCECINEDIATRPNRDLPQYTYIHGTQKSLCQVYLNDPRWYKANSGDPHVQETEIYGSLFARSNVVLNSGQANSSTTNCLQLTQIKGKLVQDCTVVLNDTIEAHKNMLFNQTPNEQKTIIKGDTHILHNLEVGRYDNTQRCNELTRINNKFEAKCDAHLNENVELNGGQGPSGITQCNIITDIFGQLQQRSEVQLNKDATCCPTAGMDFSKPDSSNKQHTIIHGDSELVSNVLLNTSCTQLTRIRGQLEAKCDTHLNENVELNGGQGASGGTQCNKITDIFGQLKQRAKVELNMDTGNCCGPSSPAFGITTNKACTIIHGDTDIRASVVLNRNCNDLTQIKGKFETQCDVKLNKSGSCASQTTEIRGVTNMKCDANVDGNLVVKGNITGEKDLQINNNATIDGTLLVKKDITGKANLLIEGNITGKKDLTIEGNTTLGKGCSNKTIVNSILDAKCETNIDGDLTGKGDATFGSGCPSSTVVMNALTKLKATELAGSLKAGTFGGSGSGTAVPTEGMALTSTQTGQSCAAGPTWNKIVNSITIPAGGALKEKANKKTGNLELDVAVCADGGVVNDTCGLAIDCDKVIECVTIPDCIEQKKIYAKSAVFHKDQNAQRPTIIMGAASNNFIGLNGDSINGTFTVSTGPMTTGTCGGVPEKGNDNDNILIRTSKNGKYCKINYIQDGGNSNGGNIRWVTNNMLAKVPDLVIPDVDCGSCPDSDPRVVSFDVEGIIDSMTGGAGTTSTSLNSGIFEFVFHKGSLERTLSGPIPYYPNVPTPNVSTDKLAEIHPSLVHWDWTDDSYQSVVEPDGAEILKLKDNEEDRIPRPSGPNKASLILLSLAALGIQKRKIASLKSEVDELKSKPKFDVNNMVVATDDTEAAAAGVDVGEVYRNGSQLMIRVS